VIGSAELPRGFPITKVQNFIDFKVSEYHPRILQTNKFQKIIFFKGEAIAELHRTFQINFN
jgi:hypothetical protein